MFNLTILNDSSEIIHYNNPKIPLYAVTGDLKSFPNMCAMVHWHEDIEFLMPVSGHITYRINEKEYVIHEGQAIFVNSKQMHFGYSADQTDCHYICIVFKTSLIASNPELYTKYIAPVTESYTINGMLITGETPTERTLLSLLNDIYHFYCEKKDCYELYAINSLTALWISLYELTKTHHTTFSYDSRSISDIITQKQMVQFIQEHFSEKISLTDIASSGNISRTKCCQLFQKYLNLTPNDYLTQYRLEQSMKLLRTTSMSATEIALSCGFNSSSYFSETFKRYKGCSPSEFRKL